LPDTVTTGVPQLSRFSKAGHHWDWSSYRHYAEGERGIVLVNEECKAEMKVRKIA
jgi:hypothetical protein